MTQNKNDSINSILQHARGSVSDFRISIFDPVYQTVQMKGSYHLLSYKDYKQLKHLSMKISFC